MGLFDFVTNRFGRGSSPQAEPAATGQGQEARLEQERAAAREEGPDAHVEGFRGRPARASEQASEADFVARMGSAARGEPEAAPEWQQSKAPTIDLEAKRALREGRSESQGEGEEAEEGKGRGASAPAPDFSRVSGAGRAPGFGAPRRGSPEPTAAPEAEQASEASGKEAAEGRGLPAGQVVESAARAARGEPTQAAAQGSAPKIDFAAKRAAREVLSAGEPAFQDPSQSEIEARFERDFAARVEAASGKGTERSMEPGRAPEIDLAGKRGLRDSGAAKGQAPAIDLEGKRALREAGQGLDAAQGPERGAEAAGAAKGSAPEIDLAGKRALRAGLSQPAREAQGPSAEASDSLASAAKAAAGRGAEQGPQSQAPKIDFAAKRAAAQGASPAQANPLLERHQKMVEQSRKASAPHSMKQDQALARAKEASSSLSANKSEQLAKEAEKGEGRAR